MDSAEKAVEILQYFNTIVTSIVSFLVFGYIMYRIKLNHVSLTYYQNFLVVQSLVYICGSVLTLIMNQRMTLSAKEESGYPFIVLPLWLNTLITSLFIIVMSGESMLLTVFNIHRVLLFLKLGKVGHFYIVTAPLAFLCVILTGISNAFFEDIFYYCLCGYYSAILFIACTCYFILRRHFRLNFYSDMVRKAQSKLTKCFLLQIVVQTCALAMYAFTPGFYFLVSVFRLNNDITTLLKGI
ncbi:hypothetical protein GCK32_007556, partial [Trichostrongylus colubriformis]